jgi:hypothetical protein
VYKLIIGHSDPTYKIMEYTLMRNGTNTVRSMANKTASDFRTLVDAWKTNID